MLPSTWHSPSLLTRSQSSLFPCSTFFGAKNFHSNVYSQSSLLLEDEDESFLSSQLDRIKKRKKSLDLSSPSNAPLYHGATKTSIKKESTMNRQKKQARHNVSKAKSESSTTSNSSFEEKDEHRQAIKHFYDLKLTGPLCKSAVHICSFKEPTEIQKRVIPAAIEGKHVIASAETGTGKTAAYVLPLLQHFYRVSNYEKRKQLPMRTNPVVLILAPTKELSEQIMDQLNKMSQVLRSDEYDCTVTTRLIIGGVSRNSQLEMLKQGCDILVGTPGRMVELVKLLNDTRRVDGEVSAEDEETLNRLPLLSQIRHLVLDECDKMLSMGFLPDLKKLFEYLPKPVTDKMRRRDMMKKLKEDRSSLLTAPNALPYKEMQVLMFSATLTRGIEDLMYRFAPVHELINLNESMQVANNVKHVQYHVGDFNVKYPLLSYLLKRKGSMKGKQVLIFVRTKQKAERLSERLIQDKFNAEAVFKSKSVSQRAKAIERFKNGELQILVSTDVLARGIDVENLPFVVNYDIPASPEDYVHRVGRTGRAGNTGLAVSFVSHYPQIVKVGMKTVELNEIHFMKTVEKFISERVEHRKIPGPWTDETLKIGPNGLPIVDMSENHAKQMVIASKKASLKILEQKFEKEKRQLNKKQHDSKKPVSKVEQNLSETYIALKQRIKQISARPASSLADAVEEDRLPIQKIPSLRNFKEGRYEDVVASFDKRRAAKAGIVPEGKKSRKASKTKQRKHARAFL